MQELKIYNNEEFGNVRTIIIDEKPWFVGKDVADALGYGNHRQALKTNVADEDKGVHTVDTLNGRQKMTIINESGLYALIFGSKLESAKRFKHWVTSEVLPSIHKDGTYSMNKTSLTDHPGEVARLINALATVMKNNQSAPKEVAENTKLICEQYGIKTISNFVKEPEYEQLGLVFDAEVM